MMKSDSKGCRPLPLAELKGPSVAPYVWIDDEILGFLGGLKGPNPGRTVPP